MKEFYATTKEILDDLNRLAKASTKKEKIEIIKNFSVYEFEVLVNLVDPKVKTGLSYAKINKNITTEFEDIRSFVDILDVFNYLKVHNTGTDKIIAEVQNFIKRESAIQEPPMYDFTFYPEIESTLMEMFSKTFKVNVGVSLINEIVPGTIFEHKVQKGSSIEGVSINPDEKVTLSIKLDGHRATLFKNGTNITILNRKGDIVEAIDIIKAFADMPDGIYDGELLHQDNSLSREDRFSATSSILNSKEDKVNLTFILFDYLKDKDDISEYCDRIANLKKIVHENEFMQIVKFYKEDICYKDVNFDEINEILEKYNLEGLMLNINKAPYKFNRTKDLLKIKKNYNIDLRITDIEIGKTGKRKGLISAFIVDYKGFPLKVGSGLSDADTKLNPQDLIGKIIEIKHYGETSDKKKNNLSVRHPVFIQFRNDKDEVSYE